MFKCINRAAVCVGPIFLSRNITLSKLAFNVVTLAGKEVASIRRIYRYSIKQCANINVLRVTGYSKDNLILGC